MKFIENYRTGLPRFHFDEAAPGGTTPPGDAAAVAAAAAAAAAAANNNKPWHDGFDPEMLGHIQNRGWDKKPVNEAVKEALKAHREAEKLIGAPAEKLIRLPNDMTDQTAMKAVMQRLGAPADAKDYDFTGIKDAAGKPLGDNIATMLRNAAGATFLPKDTATRIAQEIVKFNDAEANERRLQNETKLNEQKAALKTNWGANEAANMVAAKAAATALGVTPEAVVALESVIGYDKVMEMFRVISSKIGEDKFITPPAGGGSGIMSVEAAQARKAELGRDQEWVKRYLAGGTAEVREMTGLNTLIANSPTK